MLESGGIEVGSVSEVLVLDAFVLQVDEHLVPESGSYGLPMCRILPCLGDLPILLLDQPRDTPLAVGVTALSRALLRVKLVGCGQLNFRGPVRPPRGRRGLESTEAGNGRVWFESSLVMFDHFSSG